MIFETRLVQEEIFTFTPEGSTETLHIRSGHLRELLLAHARDKVIELTFPRQTLAEIIKNHGLEQPRMDSMTEADAMEPVIVGIMRDGSNVLFDGGHRRWFWAKRGNHVLKGWALPPEVWEAFTFDPTGPGVIKHHVDGAMLPQRRAR